MQPKAYLINSKNCENFQLNLSKQTQVLKNYLNLTFESLLTLEQQTNYVWIDRNMDFILLQCDYDGHLKITSACFLNLSFPYPNFPVLRLNLCFLVSDLQYFL